MNEFRTSGYPNTFILRIDVSLNDPDHWVTLTWTGAPDKKLATGPFRSSPGAGLAGTNCDDVATSQRDGSRCTPKGTYRVEGFAAVLGDDSRGVYVTWFLQARGIALHFFPEVPPYPASHGCVRLALLEAARIIHDNTVVGKTEVVVTGTWTKPNHQWPSNLGRLS